MLTVDHFERPFINAVLESIKETDELYDQDFNEHHDLSTKMYNIDI